jgi:hypothetical protein
MNFIMFQRYFIAKKLILRGGQNLVLKLNFWLACKHQRRFFTTLLPYHAYDVLTELLYKYSTRQREEKLREMW